MRTATQLILFLSLVMLTSCETVRTAPVRGGEDVQTSTVAPVPGARGGTGAVLLVASVEGADRGAQVCRWRVINQQTAKSFFLTIKAEEPNVFVNLDPGTYKTGRLGCGIAKVWDVDTVFAEGFRVEAGSASYLGKLIFQFQGSELQLVRKASRGESAQAMAPAIDATGAAAMGVISGFTGQAVSRGVAAESEVKDGFDVFSTGLEQPTRALAPLVTQLKSCAKSEGDAGLLGRLEYVAQYKGGRFAEMKTREANGFPDRMKSCIERGMMAFHPEGKTELVEIRVRY